MTVIKTWPQFARRVRGTTPRLLAALPEFENAILITGCQRSGGTMLNRVIMSSDSIVNFKFSKDEELDAALILSGQVKVQGAGRYCFQTTYLNECFREYFDHTNNKIVWSLRNPYSVVYSMLYNWRSFPLNELFLACGYSHMDHVDRVRFLRFGILGIPKIRRAAYAYVGKISQVIEMSRQMDEKRLTVLEYDTLVQSKERMLPELYERLELPYRSEYGDMISTRSVAKKDKLSSTERAEVDRICSAIHAEAMSLINLKH